MKKRPYRVAKSVTILLLILLCLIEIIPVKTALAQFDQNAYYQTIGQKLEDWANKYNIPPVVLKAIAWQESRWYQFHHDSSGQPISDQPLLSANGHGIGIMQISDSSDAADNDRLKTDIDYNIQRGCEILNQKWLAYPKIGNGDRNILENWYFAVWGYNGWTSGNNPNNPNPKPGGAYQDAVYNWMVGKPYNSAITQSVTVSNISKDELPALNPPNLDSLWETPQSFHQGDLNTSQANLISTGGPKGDASGDYWYNLYNTSHSALYLLYALGFYDTAYDRSTSVAEKTTLVQRMLTVYQNLLTAADSAATSSNAATVTRAGRYYWAVLQGPSLDANLAQRAKNGLLHTRQERLYGNQAQDTAITISKEGWSSASAVILAKVNGFQDALAAAPLAKKLNAPLLLTSPDQLDTQVLKEIKRLGATKVYITGGINAISSNIEAELTANNITSERIFGVQPEDTAAEIAKRMGPFTQVILASKNSFPDALAASAPAAALGIPILLTDQGSLPESTKDILQSYGITKTIIVGGSAVIASALDEGPTAPLMPFGPIRLAGNTKYDTMNQIVSYFRQDPSRIVVATGENFPDGLAGGAFAALTGSPLILVSRDSVNPETQDYLAKVKGQNMKKYILGGTAAISLAGENSIGDALVQ